MTDSASDVTPISEDDESVPRSAGPNRSQRPREQIELFKLLKTTFRRTWLEWLRNEVIGRVESPLIALCLMVLMWLLLVVVYAVFSLLSETVAQVAIWITASMTFILAFTRTSDVESSTIRRWTDRISLGRLAVAFETNRMETSILGVLIGAQWGLLGCGHWHMGMPLESMTGSQAFGYAFDNFTHAMLGDICELYGWEVMPPFRHTVWSATTFCIFRTAVSLLTLLWVRLLWHKFLARRLIRDFPADCTYLQMVDWLRGLSKSEGSWMLQFFDEFLFLRVAGEYLAGDFAAVQRLSREFPRLRVDDEVRQLFVDGSGQTLFEGFRLN